MNHEPMMTGPRYANEGGRCCPFCGSNKISVPMQHLARFREHKFGYASRPELLLGMNCTSCDSNWTEVYTLTGWEHA